MSLPRELLELAEHSNTYTPLGAGERRFEDPRFVVWLGPSKSPWSTVVQRLRLGDDVDAAVAEIRELLHGSTGRAAASGRSRARRRPPTCTSGSLALGFEPDPEPEVVGMVLTDEPPPVPAGVTVRRVETLADYAASQEIAHVAFGVPEAGPRRDARARRGGLRAAPRLTRRGAVPRGARRHAGRERPRDLRAAPASS